jgi:hypothetical protein
LTVFGNGSFLSKKGEKTMRRISLVSLCLLLLAAAACGSSSDDPGNGNIGEPEIRSQDDVQRFFEAVMPELVAVFTELASQQFAASASLSKGGGGGSTVPCPEGGSLEVDTSTGVATLVNCTAQGGVINATLALFVEPTGPSSYTATFSGTLMVTGSFVGTIAVTQASIRWLDPATLEDTCWDVTVLLNGSEESVQCEDCSCRGGGSGEACRWTDDRKMGEVRVHVGTVSDLPGISVTLSAGNQTCTIADEEGNLQLPVYGDGTSLAGLGQALLLLVAGDVVTVSARFGNRTAAGRCEVSPDAFESGAPDATAGQAFLDVYVDPSLGDPTIQCGFGFVLFRTEIRPGGMCDPDITDCFDECSTICLVEEVFEFAECGADNMCACTCTNYNP